MEKYITIKDLTFDSKEFKAYYYNYDNEKMKLKKYLEIEIIHNFEEYWIHRKSYHYLERNKKESDFIYKFLNMGIEINDFSEIKGILNSLYSLKKQKIIGFGFKNYLALSNYVLESLRQYTKIYLWGLYVYGYKDKINKQDEKKKNFSKKVKRFKSERPKQNKSYSELIYRLFPEIKEELIKKDKL